MLENLVSEKKPNMRYFKELNAMQNLGRLNSLILDKYLSLLQSEALKSDDLHERYTEFYSLKFKCSPQIKVFICELIEIFEFRNK